MYYCVIVAFCQRVLNEHAMLCYAMLCYAMQHPEFRCHGNKGYCG